VPKITIGLIFIYQYIRIRIIFRGKR